MGFGHALDNALSEAVDQGKRKKPLSAAQRNQKITEVMSRWLGSESVERKYRDPMASR